MNVNLPANELIGIQHKCTIREHTENTLDTTREYEITLEV